MTARSDDDEPTFSQLIGETRPVKRRGDVLPPAVTPPKSRQREAGGPAATRAFRRPDPEEPRLAAADGVSDRQLLDLRRGDPEPEERIDLHGLRADAAPRILAQRIESASQRDLRCLLVVHGRGARRPGAEAVLRDSLPQWLMSPPNAKTVMALAPAPTRLGGDGATLVLLRTRAPKSAKNP